MRCVRPSVTLVTNVVRGAVGALTACPPPARAAAGTTQRGAPDGEQHHRGERDQVGGYGEGKGQLGEHVHPANRDLDLPA